MRVRLKNSWYTIRNELYQPGVYKMPDEWLDELPPSAEVIGDAEVVVAVPVVTKLADYDYDRQNSDEVMKVVNKVASK